jgi:uncharacterized membrane protein YeiH
MYILDLIGTFAFAITGALKAKGKGLHLFGALFFAIITAIGGGTIRDLIINRAPLFYLRDQNYLLIAVLAGIITYYIPTFFRKWYSVFRFIDSVGLSAFAIIGVSATYLHLFLNSGPSIISFVVCVFLGMLTAFGGGIIRDSVAGDVPISLTKGSNYANSAFVGSTIFYCLMFINSNLAIVISMLATLFLREIFSPYGVYKKFFVNKKSK